MKATMLYLVATPIGNLGDITLRALETLRAVDVIASEDTRRTGILLKHFDIHKPQVTFHEHNEDRAGGRIMALLEEGKSVAVVTEAGTPGISDPGFSIVRRAIGAGVEVTMIPGPAALVMAVVLSGLPVHSFTYRGFPPHKPGPRRRFLEVDRDSPHTLIFYESPYRVEALLADALLVYGDRDAALAHELTKIHESFQRGKLSELLAAVRETPPKGEYVVVVAGAGRTPTAIPDLMEHPERSSRVWAAESKDAALARPLRRPSTAPRPKDSRASAQDASARDQIDNHRTPATA